MKKLTFSISMYDKPIGEKSFTQRIIKIGKLGTADLRLDDTTCSRMHCVIECSDDGKVWLIDLGSVKGSIINGLKLSHAFLHDGDVIVWGDTKCVLKIEDVVETEDA